MISDQPNQHFAETEEVFIFPSSFAQQRLWFVEQLVPEATLYTIPLVFRLTGFLQRTALENSFQAIVDRHEVLRTTFNVIDGQLVQVVLPHLPISLPLIHLKPGSDQKFEEIALEQIRQETQQPFNLSQGPLFRVRLWQFNRTDHLLLILLHHIIFDEWSSGVLIRELGELYSSCVANKPVALPELPIQYADFAHWQRQWLQGEVLNAQLRYWRQQLQNVPTLHLPMAARPPEQRYQGAIQLLELPQQGLDRLEELSQQAGVTLFMTLLAAFQTLLYRYTGQEDIAVGSPIANRHRSELEGLIGFLVNSLVLRTDLSGDPTFYELLERVKNVTLTAYAHQDLPFEKLVEELQPVRSLGQNPLFQVVFALQNTPMEQLELPGLTLSAVEFETKTTRFDLELYVWKCAGNFRNLWGKGWQQTDGLRGVVVYNTDLFDAETIAHLRHHLQTLLESVVAHPHTRLSQLPLLTALEQQQLLANWNSTQTHYPDHTSIHRLFEAQVQQRPDAIAVQFGSHNFSYQALNQGGNQLARYLQKHGITAGKPVGICLERSPEAIAAMLAILKAGGAYVPLDPSYPLERLHFLLEDAHLSVVLTQERWATAFNRGQTQVICLDQEWEAIVQEPDHNLPDSGTADQLAYIIYTSGSTGTPKGVMVPHQAVNRLVCHTNYIEIESRFRVAQVANLAFDAATFEVWGALLNGAQLIGIEREITLSPTDFATELQMQQIDVMFLTTALFNQTVSQVPHAFQSLRYLLFGGENANPDRVHQVLQQGKPQHLIHVYGPTENTTFSTWYEVQQIPKHSTSIPIGQAIANTQVYVLDAHLCPVPAGISGEIYLGGDGLAQGYLNHPELTQEKFISNYKFNAKLYKTGDRARYYPDGNLEFLGRVDHQVKIRGFRVELGEIEMVLMQHPTVQTAVVVTYEIESDCQLVAYVVPMSSIALTERELRRFVQAKLPVYMVPARFIMLDKLPITSNGKVDVRILPSPLLTGMQEPVVSNIPKTSLEKSLVDLWSQLLGRKQVGIQDNFFELGGHSLMATQLVSRIRDRFQVELPLRSLFEAPTIAELAQKIAALQWVAPQPDTLSNTESSTKNPDLVQEMQQREEIEL
ncbi:MAG: hypothetical protein Kow00121_47110 [Elainellaceae cyanobacterium]